MANQSESIEAQLAAFIDGELDAAGKVEIEKHLAANPQHRALLDELMRQKTFVQALPRESAPPELAETLQGHLERSVLLDGVGTADAGATMNVNRLPQYVGIAAVLALAAGLGVLVYAVLPSRGNKEPTYAVNKKAARERDELTTEPMDKQLDVAPAAGPIEPTIPSPAMAMNAKPQMNATDNNVADGMAAANANRTATATPAAAGGADAASENGRRLQPDVAAALPAQATQSPPRLLITMSAVDPQKARAAVSRFCGDRLYAISPVPQSMIASADQPKDLSAGVLGVSRGFGFAQIAMPTSGPAPTTQENAVLRLPSLDAQDANGPMEASAVTGPGKQSLLIAGISRADASALLQQTVNADAGIGLIKSADDFKDFVQPVVPTTQHLPGGQLLADQVAKSAVAPRNMMATTSPASQPTTEPVAVAATQPVSDRIDLVLVIKPATPTTEPSTPPASQPAFVPATFPAEAVPADAPAMVDPTPATQPTSLPTTEP